MNDTNIIYAVGSVSTVDPPSLRYRKRRNSEHVAGPVGRACGFGTRTDERATTFARTNRDQQQQHGGCITSGRTAVVMELDFAGSLNSAHGLLNVKYIIIFFFFHRLLPRRPQTGGGRYRRDATDSRAKRRFDDSLARGGVASARATNPGGAFLRFRCPASTFAVPGETWTRSRTYGETAKIESQWRIYGGGVQGYWTPPMSKKKKKSRRLEY